MSRRRFLELSFFAIAGLALTGGAGCGGRSVLRPGIGGGRTNAAEGKEHRKHWRGRRGLGVGRIIRLILRRVL